MKPIQPGLNALYLTRGNKPNKPFISVHSSPFAVQLKMNGKKSILLTIDVEDWFQVENFKPWIPFSSWDSFEPRVERNTHRLLDLFDSIEVSNTMPAPSSQEPAASNLSREIHTNDSEAYFIGTSTQQPTNNNKLGDSHLIQNSKLNIKNFGALTNPTNPNNPNNPINPINPTNTPKATFFVLAWLAERLPHLVREIHARGHEVASHGYNHNLWNHQTREELKKDLIGSKKLLEDIIGSKVFGYRSPSFAINDDILKIIKDCGYLYDSSYNSFGMNSRYGQVDFSRNGKNGITFQVSENFWELPISNIDLGNYVTRPLNNVQFCKILVLPWGGGGYFRLTPSPLFKIGVKTILKKSNAYLFYLHPWEIDEEQPEVNEVSWFYKFRHYQNLKKTYLKLSKFIGSFQQCRFINCRKYLEELEN